MESSLRLIPVYAHYTVVIYTHITSVAVFTRAVELPTALLMSNLRKSQRDIVCVADGAVAEK